MNAVHVKLLLCDNGGNLVQHRLPTFSLIKTLHPLVLQNINTSPPRHDTALVLSTLNIEWIRQATSWLVLGLASPNPYILRFYMIV